MFHQNIATPVRSSAKYLVVVGLTLLLVGIGYSVYLYKKESSSIVTEGAVPQKQQLAKSMLKMPANGNSPNLPTKPGYAVEWTGSGFTIHCVYRDGSTDIGSCRDGPMLYQYLRDTSGRANTATYVFVRPD